MAEVIVGSLMTELVTTCSPETQLKDVVRTMSERIISCVIVTVDHEPVGIVTERDLVRVLSDNIDQQAELPYMTVENFMTSAPLMVQESTPLFEALVITQTRGFRHLPVVDDRGQLRGMLTFSDLAKAYENIISIQKAMLEQEVGSKTRHLKEINDQLKAMSFEDPLLGVGNRRSMEVDLEYTHNTARRYGRHYAIALFDVDYFKQYNDHYGHQAGDDALKTVANCIAESIRTIDRLYRYGGEELLLLMPETEYEGAVIVTRRIVKSLAQLEVAHQLSPLHVLTMSGGVASIDNSSASVTWKGLIKKADKKLYNAKHSGRNQVGD